MPFEYKLGRCSRQCYVEKRALADGEWYYSVVLDSEDEFVRRDYSAGAWQGPPEGAIGFWKCRMPAGDEKKTVLAPKAVLIDLLRQLGSFPEKAKTRYLLALMMVRRKIVKLLPPDSNAGDETDDSIETMTVEVLDDGSQIEISVCEIARSETDSLTEALNEMLYCEASELETME